MQILRTSTYEQNGATHHQTDYLIGFDKDIPLYGDSSQAMMVSANLAEQTLQLCKQANPESSVVFV